MRRDDICLYLGPADRAQLEVLLTDRNTSQKVVWRAGIILAIADRCGTNEIMRRAGTSKPTVWRWQARYPASSPSAASLALTGRRGLIGRAGEPEWTIQGSKHPVATLPKASTAPSLI